MRKLRVLLIEDNKGIEKELNSCVELISYKSDDITTKQISTLRDATYYWEKFSTKLLPDIILGDINFEHDLTTPLQILKEKAINQGRVSIPNGLMHIKPLAAVARALGRPMKIALYTSDESLWKRLAENRDCAISQAIGALVVHEIFELSSILGKRIPFAEKTHMTRAWEWLSGYPHKTVQDAFVHAMEIFREDFKAQLDRRLTESHNLLKLNRFTRKKLIPWSKEMHQQSKNLLESSNDIGIKFKYSNGLKDHISIASLFADLPGIETGSINNKYFIIGNSRELKCQYSEYVDNAIGKYLYELVNIPVS